MTTAEQPAPTGRKIALPVKLAFSLGQIAESMHFGLFIGFSAIFYNQAVGLSNSLIGLATMIAIFADAAVDPLIGSLSDGWRSRYGRRHPFLFIAPVPVAVSLYFLFQPPEFLTAIPAGSQIPDQIPLFLWMTVWTVIGRVFLAFYSVPHLALGAELSTDYDERSSIFSYNAMAGFFFGANVGYVAYTFFFADERIRASDGALVPGHLDPAAYGPLMLFAGAAIIVGVLTCAFVTLRELPHLSQPGPDAKRFSFVGAFRDLWSAMHNPHYVSLLIGLLFLSLTLGVHETVGTFMVTYYWEFVPSELRWFSLAFAFGYVAGAFATPLFIHLTNKRFVCVAGISIYTVLVQFPVLARMLDLAPENGSPLLLPLLLINAVLATFCLGSLNVCVMSMLADISDQHELSSGRRQEGIFYSARMFFAKASNSLSHLIAGVALDYVVRFPFNAIPGKVDADVLFRLGLVGGPIASVGAAIAIIFYARYRLSREDHAQIRRSLETRKAAKNCASDRCEPH